MSYDENVLLKRREFLNEIEIICQNDKTNTSLAYITINNAPEVARIKQGRAAAVAIINYVEKYLADFVKNDADIVFGKLSFDSYGLILRNNVGQSCKILDNLVMGLERKTLRLGTKIYYPQLIVGLTPMTPDYPSYEIVTIAANEALRQAKNIGHSVVKVLEFNDADLRQRITNLRLLPKIREALRAKKFVLFAQPIVALNTSHLPKKMEILLRYNDNRNYLSPYKYLKAAEALSLSRQIDRYVLENFAKYYQRFATPEHLYSINIAGGTVRSDFFEFSKRIFKKYKVNPEQVCFELTENVVSTDGDYAQELMNSLKGLGCQLALDDIGVGSSNLANMPRINVDYFKIDGSFIVKMLEDDYSLQVIKFVQMAAEKFGKETVAEFVETQEQLEQLKSLGIHYIQGYLKGKPELLFDPAKF